MALLQPQPARLNLQLVDSGGLMRRKSWQKRAKLCIGLAGVFFGMAHCEGGFLRPSGRDSGQGGGATTADGGTLPLLPGSTQVLIDASVVPMRHLLRREVILNYSMLLGPTPSADFSKLPSDMAGGYDNNVAQQSVSPQQLSALMLVAQQAANDAISANSIKTILGCADGSITRACMQSFVTNFGRRVYRRPLAEDESSAYLALWASQSDPLEGARLVTRTFLASPNFYFQPQLGMGTGEKPGYVHLSDYEIATRLSLLLTGTNPSDALLAQAAAGSLHTADAVGKAAAEILATPAGKLYLRNFASNWLGLNTIPTVTGATGIANDTPQARGDMVESALLLFDDYMAPDKKLMDMFVAPYAYVSPALAPIYGIAAPPIGQWQKASLENSPRVGLLSLPSTMALSGVSQVPSIKRGIMLRSRYLCEGIPAQPANVVPIPPSGDGTSNGADASEREKLASHTGNPACSGCHKLMDGLGFGMEQFDNLGNFRSADHLGHALTGQAQLVEAEQTTEFTGVAQLAAILAKMPKAQACLTENLAAYLLGYFPSKDDLAMLTRLQSDLNSVGLAAAVVNFCRSDSFLYRKISA